MHNCKATREQVTEFLLDGAGGNPDGDLSAELRECADCRQEFAALEETLRITTRLIETTAPPEIYWPGYHARLKQKLTDATVRHVGRSWQPVGRNASWPLWLRRFFRSSVPVPVPVFLAVLLVFALSLVLAFRASPQEHSQPQSLSTVRVPVEVPVVQERIVTRVVYRQRDRLSRSGKSKPASGPSRGDSAVAKSQKPVDATNPVSLIGFKPTEEIKLTVIKGGPPNEK